MYSNVVPAGQWNGASHGQRIGVSDGRGHWNDIAAANGEVAALRIEVERLRHALAENGEMHRRGDRPSDRTNPSVVEALQSHVDEVRPSGVGTTQTPCKHVYMYNCAGIHKERERESARARASERETGRRKAREERGRKERESEREGERRTRQVAEARPGQPRMLPETKRLVNQHVQQKVQRPRHVT